MDNKTLDVCIEEAIAHNIANNKQSLAHSCHVTTDEVDRGLERLRRRGAIAYDKATKRWNSASQPSALSVAPVVQPTGDAAASADKTENTNMSEDTSTSRIDAAINAAKAKKQKKDKPATTEASTEKSARPRLTAEQKAERDAKREADKAQRKADRDAKRAAKQAERAAARKPAHMSKVEKAAAKLPALSTEAQAFFNDVSVNLAGSDLAALALHIQHFNRVHATERALAQKVEAGSKVKIVGGDPRFIGMEGTVTKAQRIRCYVEVAAAKKPVYLFTSDVEVTAAAPAQAASNG